MLVVTYLLVIKECFVTAMEVTAATCAFMDASMQWLWLPIFHTRTCNIELQHAMSILKLHCSKPQACSPPMFSTIMTILVYGQWPKSLILDDVMNVYKKISDMKQLKRIFLTYIL